MLNKKFELGLTVLTRGIADRMGTDMIFNSFVYTCLEKYMGGDWGDLDDEDKQVNEDALKYGERIFAAYIFQKDTDEKIWIITEWDRSVTTILFPSEY